jgi:superfamily II DNA or RNA helicase
MSIRIEKNKISEDQKNIIGQCLLYKVEEDGLYSKGSSSTLQLFLPDGKDILLPFAFGKKMFGMQRMHWVQYGFTFTSNLFSHQQPIFQESLQTLLAHNSVLLSLYTGFGKTIMGAALSASLGLRTCVVTVQTVLPKQWEETFTQHTNAKVEVFKTKGKIQEETQVVVVTVGMIEKMSEELRQSFGTIIIDEAHSFCTRTRLHPLLLFEPKYIIAETATFERPDGAEAMMKAIIGVKKVHVPLQKNFKVIKVNTKIVPEVSYIGFGGNKRVNWNGLIKSLVQNPYRLEIIISWIKNNLDKKALLLTDRKEMITMISQRLGEEGVKHDFLFGNKKTYSDSQVLLGTHAKIGVGFDEKNACPDYNQIRINLVYILFSTKQQWLLEQSAGRGFRSEMPTIVDFVDDNSICQNHFKSREKWYKSRGGQIQEVTVEPPPLP